MVKVTTKFGKVWRIFRDNEDEVAFDKPETHLQRMYHDESGNAWIETYDKKHIMLDKDNMRAGNALYVRD